MTVEEALSLPVGTELRYASLSTPYFLARRGIWSGSGRKEFVVRATQETGFLWVSYDGTITAVPGLVRNFRVFSLWPDLDQGPDAGL